MMGRIGCLLALSLAVLATAAPAQPLDGVPAPEGRRTMTLERESRSAALDVLYKYVEEVDWLEITFEEVIEWLRAESEGRVNIIPRWNALAEEGVTRESLVTLQIQDTNVAMVVEEVLQQLSDRRNVAYRAIGNNLRISTKQDFGTDMETRVYEVLDLVFVMPDMGRNAPTIDLNAASRQSSGGGSGQSVFGGGTSSSSQDLEQEENEVEERIDELTEIITKQIEPSSWQENGGLGTVASFNNRVIVIYNTVEVHEKVAGYFSYSR